jgi:superfamily II DNA helicase RecQ
MSLSKLQPLIDVRYNADTMVDPDLDALLLLVFELGGVNLRDWQKASVYCCLKKKDLIVKAGTGAGKTWVFWAMALSQPKGIVLVIAPLKAIMSNHVKYFVADANPNSI